VSEDLLSHDIERPFRSNGDFVVWCQHCLIDPLLNIVAELFGDLKGIAGKMGCHPVVEVVLLQLAKVTGRVPEPIGMIDAQTGCPALGQHSEDQLVGGLEDFGQLDSNGGQVIDVEEAPVIDLLSCHPPECQAVGLLFDQPIEQIKAARIVPDRH
jgi:hypothetical protein